MNNTTSVRAVTTADLPMVLSWRNHPEVRRFMFTQHEITMQEHRSWFAKASQDSTRCLLMVEDALQPIGYVQFSNVAVSGVADWGFYVRPDAPKGTGRKLGAAALRHAFQELRLHKVCGQAIESNEPSIAFHKRLGFSQEGVLRQQQRIDGVYHSLYCFGLIADEWKASDLSQENSNVQD